MMTVSVRMNLVLGIPRHVACVPTVFPTSGQVTFVVMLGAVGTTRSSGMARCTAQRCGSGEAAEVKMGRMGTVTMRVTAERRMVEHLRVVTT